MSEDDIDALSDGVTVSSSVALRVRLGLRDNDLVWLTLGELESVLVTISDSVFENVGDPVTESVGE